MDGAQLAAERTPLLAHRAHALRARRGAPPRLLLAAFAGDDGRAPHVQRKLRACADAGVAVVPLILPASVTTDDAVRRLHAGIHAQHCDGVFLQFPYPDSVDGDALADTIPPPLDVDIMTAARTAHYFAHDDATPPVTITAALLLLDRYRIHTAARTGVVVGDDSPFTHMFRAALARRGASMQPLLSPQAPDLRAALQHARIVIAAAARPGLISSAELPPHAVAIDVGYFNPGGRGDIDTAGGIRHLDAIAPVPGGIGPMTISALVERVIAFAEAG